jgi:WD40 repeat protein
MSLAPDGRRLVAGGSDGTLHHWDLDRRIPIAIVKAHDAAVRGIAWNRNGSELASASADGSVTLFSARDGYRGITHRFEAPAGVRAIAWLGDSRIGLALADGQVGALKTSTPEEFTPLQRHAGWASAMLDRGMDGVLSTGKDGEVRDSVGPLLRVSKPLFAAAQGPLAEYVAAGDEGGSIYIVDPKSRRLRAVLRDHEGAIRSLHFPSARLLASGGDDGFVRFWLLDALSADPRSIEAQVERNLGLFMDGTRVVRRPVSSRAR